MAGPYIYDRVRETTTTTGTGTVTLAGAATGFRSFSVVGNGNTCYYCIEDGTNWEVGLGTYSTTGPTLARTVVFSSSNANALVSFGAGTKNVFLAQPTAMFGSPFWLTVSGDTTLTNEQYVFASGTITITLPSAVTCTHAIEIKNTGTGTIKVVGPSSQTIDGATQLDINVQNAAYKLVPDGSNWVIF